MKIKIFNSSVVFATKEPERILELEPILVDSRGGAYYYRSPLSDGSNTDSYGGNGRGYYVDLTGLYAQGYRSVRFKANKYNGVQGAVMGLVATSPIPDTRDVVDVVESCATDANNGVVEWYELPITENSKCLHSTYMYQEREGVETTIWTPTNGDAVASNKVIS